MSHSRGHGRHFDPREREPVSKSRIGVAYDATSRVERYDSFEGISIAQR